MSQGPCELTQLKMMISFLLGNRKSISFSPLLPWQLNWMEKTQLMTGKKEQSKMLKWPRVTLTTEKKRTSMGFFEKRLTGGGPRVNAENEPPLMTFIAWVY